MMRVMSLTMCLLLPVSAFAQDAVPPPVPEAAGPVTPPADQPTQASLVPTDAAPNGATDGTRSCGMSRGCGGRSHGKGKWIVLTGVVGTILTAAAVGIAVGASQRQLQTGQIPQ